jgi:hypothetical protein
LGFGAAGASAISVGFWVKANRTGSYGAVIQEYNVTRSYPFSFSVISSGVWEFKTAIVPGDTAGTWATDSAGALVLRIAMMVGSTFAGAAGAWAASDFRGVTGQTNGVAATSDFMQITGVVVLAGSVTLTSDMISRLTKPFADTLQDCQRYYEKSFDYPTVPAQNVGVGTGEFFWTAVVAGAVTHRTGSVSYKTRKRAAGTITLFNPAAANAQARDETGSLDFTVTSAFSSTEVQFRITATGNAGSVVGNLIGIHWVSDARL